MWRKLQENTGDVHEQKKQLEKWRWHGISSVMLSEQYPKKLKKKKKTSISPAIVLFSLTSRIGYQKGRWIPIGTSASGPSSNTEPSCRSSKGRKSKAQCSWSRRDDHDPKKKKNILTSWGLCPMNPSLVTSTFHHVQQPATTIVLLVSGGSGGDGG